MIEEALLRKFSKSIGQGRVIDGRYRLLHKLGGGRFGKVFLCYDFDGQNLVAMKSLRRKLFSSRLKHFLAEINILINLRFKGSEELRIAHILEFQLQGEDQYGRQYCYYTMRFVEYGDLFKLMEEKREFSEDELRFLIYQLIECLQELHKLNCYHFDLKPENILLDTNLQVFLCDFGGCLRIREDQKSEHQRLCSTPEYESPELDDLKSALMRGEINLIDYSKVEMFQVGVILFVLTFGYFPFQRASEIDQNFRSFLSQKEKFWGDVLKIRKVSHQLVGLLNNLLEPEIRKRISVDSALRHEWFQRLPEIDLEELKASFGEIFLLERETIQLSIS